MAKPLPSRARILQALEDAGRAVHAREVAKRCRVEVAEYGALLVELERLGEEGVVGRLPGQRFVALHDRRAEPDRWDGFLNMNARGFGFVGAPGHEDVYVPPEAIAGAVHGDRVTIEVVNESRRGLEGRVVAVVERQSPRIAGLLRRGRKSCWLEPDDSRIRGPIVLPHDTAEGSDGDAAVVTITRFPEVVGENPEATLMAILGQPGELNTEVAKILLREQVEELHSDAAYSEAEMLARRYSDLGELRRVNLRDVPLPTIDPADARDHDDAIWVQRTRRGFRAWVAIADVSEFVTPGSALDEAARTRGCSIYLPDRAIPMLPLALSADLCSLLPDRDRLCLCVIADLDRKGKVVEYELVEGVMRSQAMLTYEGVARTLGWTEAGPVSRQAEGMKKELQALADLAEKLRASRMERGALDLELPEPKVELDRASGQPTNVVARGVDPGVRRSYQLVEELMLLANELVARWLTDRQSPAIYRVHGRPDEAKLERLAEAAELLGVPVEIQDLLEPKGVRTFIQAIADHPRKRVLEMLLLRSLKQASYDIGNIGHFGLASDCYVHFTSPIRRYPDLEIHRAVKRILRGEKLRDVDGAKEALRESALTSSQRERASMDVEREILDLYRCIFMQGSVGKVFTGTISAVVGTGVFVVLMDPFVDVLVRWEELGNDRYEEAFGGLGAVGVQTGDKVQVGDPMTVEIIDVALLRRQILGARVQTRRNQRPTEGRASAARAGVGRPTAGRAPAVGRTEEAPAAAYRGSRKRVVEAIAAPPARGPRKRETPVREEAPKKGRTPKGRTPTSAAKRKSNSKRK